jgi:hypothetical protein
MALWGKADNLFSPGTVSVNYSTETITGAGTSFTAAGISTGTTIVIGVGGTYGQAVISGITSDLVVSIATTQYLSGAAISGVGYTLTQKPVYTLEDSNYAGIQTTSTGLTNAVYGVDEYEAAANAATGSKYKVAHAGWVGIHTYIDQHGTLRVKSEVLVAMSGISSNVPATYGATGDALDDAVFPDRYITITTQPVSLSGVSTTAAQSFSVVASATPTASLTFQWQYASYVGAGFTNLTNAGIYSNVTTSTVGIGSTTVGADIPDGYQYRAIIASTGGATATSNAATLDYA